MRFSVRQEIARDSIEELLNHSAPDVLAVLQEARVRLDADRTGFLRAVATAHRESIGATVLRAIVHGLERFRPPVRLQGAYRKTVASALRLQQAVARGAVVDVRALRGVVDCACSLAPMLILIDEFGKNLEAFADFGGAADLYVLQQLAEWTAGTEHLPLVIVTLQHMAFDEYAEGASSVQRREWTKVQGRFEDIAFVDSPAQTQALIAAAFTDPAPKIAPVLKAWSEREASMLADLGLRGLVRDSELLARCWPLHPFVVGTLPELCARYGQNERTLFSFLAGSGPDGVSAFLANTRWNPKADLPLVRLNKVYDYFVSSAAGLVGVTAAASRWLEIDTRIQDARGIDAACQRVLKTVGLLNLVSAGGTLRASRAVVFNAVADGTPGTRDHRDVAARLDELEKAGLITWRDFADEYRVWQGSDFDIRTAIRVGRRRMLDESPANVLTRVLPLDPLVAARHSHQTGTLRAFERGWIDKDVQSVGLLGPSDRGDGLALYVLGPQAPTASVEPRDNSKPVTFVVSPDPADLIDAAREVAAIDEVFALGGDVETDWVARRELKERRVEARMALDREFQRAYATAFGATWHWIKPGGRRWQLVEATSPSAVLSTIADAWYGKALVVHNDLVNRNELSSQAARARRVLIEAMLTQPREPRLGIEGFGPESSMYMSVLNYLGLHEVGPEGWSFRAPSEDRCQPVWDELVKLIVSATSSRVRVSDLYESLAGPPFGLRSGICPILLVAGLIIYAEDVALYEHGTFRPTLTPETSERLLRNPENFELKFYGSRSGNRAALLTAMADRLDISASRMRRSGRVGSVLAIVSQLVSMVNSLPEYSRKTFALSGEAIAVRRAILAAVEPDELVFKSIPLALGENPIHVGGACKPSDITRIAKRLQQAVTELSGAYSALLSSVRNALREELRGLNADVRGSLAARARELLGRVIDPRLTRLIAALTADIPSENEWLEYVGMVLTDVAPASWTDDDRRGFFTQLHDVGGTFRRIEALNADARSRGEGFDALHVTVTRPDGAESAKLVWVDEMRREALRPVLTSALKAARRQAESDSEAREILLALLAEQDLNEVVPEVSDKVHSDPSESIGKVVS